MRYWIFDRNDSPQGLPLGDVFLKIRRVVDDGGCTLLVRRSEGYGRRVRELDVLLDDQDEVALDPDELQRLATGDEEWFYWLDAACVAGTRIVGFGVFDSTALYVDATAEVAAAITDGFRDVRADGGNGGDPERP